MKTPGGICGAGPSSSVASSTDDVWRWSADVEAQGRAPRLARDAVGAVCSHRYDPSTIVDIQLVVSELVTNCIEHGHVDCVRLSLLGIGDRVSVTVASAGSLQGVPQPDTWCLPTATACSGRGLAMIGRIGCADLSVDDGDDGWSAITVQIEPRAT